MICDARAAGSRRITSQEARMEVPPLNGVKLKTDENGFLRDRRVGGHRQLEPAHSRQMRPRTRPRDHHGDQHDVRQPDRERLASLNRVRISSSCAALRRRQRRPAESANRLRPPNFHEQEKNPEGNQRPAQVRQIRAQIMRHGPLARRYRKASRRSPAATLRSFRPSR